MILVFTAIMWFEHLVSIAVEANMANGSRSDFKELRKLQWKIMEDVAASALIPLMRIGDELDLFKKLDKFGPITSEHFANKANIDERYAREWLLALAASGYISFSKKDKMFFLSAAQVAVFADEDSPALMIGAYDLLDGTIRNQEKIRKAEDLCFLIFYQ